MAALRFIETLALIAAAIFAIRRATPAASPYGRRMAWIALLLAAQLGVLYALVAFQARWHWGVATAPPIGVASVVQTLRALLLLAAAGAWLGLVRGEFGHRWQLGVAALGVLALGWGAGAAPFLAAIVLGFGFNRMKWIEDVTGWRRALAVVPAAALLAGL